MIILRALHYLRAFYKTHVFTKRRKRYIREVLSGIVDSNIGCNIGGYMVNILAYADDLVLLAPSWTALQQLLDKLQIQLMLLICVATARKLSV